MLYHAIAYFQTTLSGFGSPPPASQSWHLFTCRDAMPFAMWDIHRPVNKGFWG